MSTNTLENCENGIILHFSGIYTNDYNRGLLSNIKALVEYGYIYQIWNLEKLSDIPDTGFGPMGKIVRAVMETGGGIVLFQIKENVKLKLQNIGFSELFNIVSKTEEAIKYFNNKRKLDNHSGLPKEFACLICSNDISVNKKGKIKCKNCRTVFDIQENGDVYFG